MGGLVGACQGAGDPGPGGARGQPTEGLLSRLPSEDAFGGSPTDPRNLRFHKVDVLVAQWDAAQADGRLDQADALALQVGAEVDATAETFADFAQAAAGGRGARLQYLAVSALGFSRRPEATGLLVDRLVETDPGVVGTALIALKVRADPATPLAPILKHVTSAAPAPRRFAPLALANVVQARRQVGMAVEPELERAALHALSGVVAHRDPLVRLHVAKALGALGGPAAYELLRILLEDETVRIRVAAAAGLERIGDPRGFPGMIRLLESAPEDWKPIVRDLMVSYAERIGGRPLDEGERQRMGTSARAWSAWFTAHAARTGLQLSDEPTHPGGRIAR